MYNEHKHPIDAFTDEDGFWKLHTRDTLIDAYEFLVNQGVDEERVFTLLQNVYEAVCGEFGG